MKNEEQMQKDIVTKIEALVAERTICEDKLESARFEDNRENQSYYGTKIDHINETIKMLKEIGGITYEPKYNSDLIGYFYSYGKYIENYDVKQILLGNNPKSFVEWMEDII